MAGRSTLPSSALRTPAVSYTVPLSASSPAIHGVPSTSYSGNKRTRSGLQSPSDELFPHHHSSKKPKCHHTTAPDKTTRDLEGLRSLRMLQLARASREAFAAHAKYHLLRLHELDIMRAIALDEFEEAQAFVKDADRQIGEIRYMMNRDGDVLFEDSDLKLSSLHFAPIPSCDNDSDVEDDLSSAQLPTGLLETASVST